MQNLQDDELVDLAKGGDQGAFGELMRRNGPMMRKTAISILRDPVDAEDELQNAWSSAWQHVESFAGESRFSTWMTRIVMNRCLMRLRQARRANLLYLDESVPGAEGLRRQLTDPSDTPEEALRHREALAVLRREMQRIPPLLRKTLLLRDVEELPMEQVAGALGISVAAAKSRLLRGRQELRLRMTQAAAR